MNITYKINANFAVSKAIDAVKSWQKALEEQKAKKDQEGIEVCEKFLKGCQENLAKVRESVKHEHIWN